MVTRRGVVLHVTWILRYPCPASLREENPAIKHNCFSILPKDMSIAALSVRHAMANSRFSFYMFLYILIMLSAFVS